MFTFISHFISYLGMDAAGAGGIHGQQPNLSDEGGKGKKGKKKKVRAPLEFVFFVAAELEC